MYRTQAERAVNGALLRFERQRAATKNEQKKERNSKTVKMPVFRSQKKTDKKSDPGRTRTHDLRIMRPTRYQLRHAPKCTWTEQG